MHVLFAARLLQGRASLPAGGRRTTISIGNTLRQTRLHWNVFRDRSQLPWGS